jgi:glycosyltransferase involved in cell wall biosynthesis
MKLVHAVGWYFPDSLGGTEVYVADIAKRQIAEGHEVTVVAPLAGLDVPTKKYTHDGVPVVRFAIPAHASRDEAQSRVRTRGSEMFDAVVAELKPDLVHFHTFTTGLSLAEIVAARMTGARVIATNHLGSLGYICQRGSLMVWGKEVCDGKIRIMRCSACALQQKGLSRPGAWATAAVGRALGGRHRPESRIGTALGMPDLISKNAERQQAIIQQLDCFVLLSRDAHEIVVRNGADPGKLAVNYLGTNHSTLTRKPSPDKKPTELPLRIGYVGRLYEPKGVLDLARAFSVLPSSMPIELEFCGSLDDPDSTEVAKAIVEATGNDPRVKLVGSVPPSEIPARLASYDLLCVPSVTFEGGPTVIHEARAAGTPVVGTRIGAIPELIRDGIDGALVKPGDWKALSKVFQSAMANPRDTIDVWRRNIPPPRSMDDVWAEYSMLYSEVLAR